MKLTLTDSQKLAFNNIKDFVADKNSKVFILKGYAGTGKTTLVRKIIEEFKDQKIHFTLLASTGRAAKILANTTQCEAKTIHSCIYRFVDLNQDLDKLSEERDVPLMDSIGQLLLNFELQSCDLDDSTGTRYYIVDESSMISDEEDKNITQARFGSGKLLCDLLNYDIKGKFIFVGDACQLPPVTQHFSPAMLPQYFEQEFGITPYVSELTEIMRQDEGNDIAVSAQKMRGLFYHPQPWKWAKFPLRGYKNIHIINSHTKFISKYIQMVKANGYNDTTLICFSNRQCDMTTSLLRPNFGHLTDDLEKGDLLLVTQNNLITGLMNGDLVTVQEVTIHEHRAGLTFLRVSIRELFTQKVYSQLMIAEILYGIQTNLTQAQQKELMIDFYIRMSSKGIKQKSQEFTSAMMSDPYLNALRAVFGYALTCHKAQGGEWYNVYLDIPRNLPSIEKPYVYQWVYTAMTRAKCNLYIVDDFWVI